MTERTRAIEVSEIHFVQPSKYKLDKVRFTLEKSLTTIGGNSFLLLLFLALGEKL